MSCLYTQKTVNTQIVSLQTAMEYVSKWKVEKAKNEILRNAVSESALMLGIIATLMGPNEPSDPQKGEPMHYGDKIRQMADKLNQVLADLA